MEVKPEGPDSAGEPPPRPVTETERRTRSIANLEKIGKAIAAYTAKHGRLPVAGTPRDGELLLSWRVLILPELGYPELAVRFRNEPWNGPTNKLLLEYIPPEYQSPERFDSKTNYLGVSGREMLFPTDALEGVSSGLPRAAVKDGLDNTLAVVEVDDKFAQEWTKPADYEAQLDAPGARLGGLRGEGAFGALASGRVVLLPRDLSPAKFAALFTVAGGEPIGSAKEFLSAPTAEPPPPTLATVADDPNAANPAALTGDNSPTPAATTAEDPATPEATSTGPRYILAEPYTPDPKKRPVPGEAELAKSRELLKQLYGKQYEEARTRQDRQRFLAILLAEVPAVEQNPGDLHELARIARDLAVSLGDASSAFKACEVLEQAFQIDPLPMRLKVVQDLGKQSRESPAEGSDSKAEDEAEQLVRLAVAADRYDVAIPAHDALLVLARARNQDRSELAKLQQRTDELTASKSLFLSAQKAVEALKEKPGDPDANEAVGRYLCFVKNRWEAGLPFLAKAGDIRLRGIASLETTTDRSAASVLALADQYWDLAAKFKQPQRRGIHLRAAYCYELVSTGLAASLEKIKGQRRIDEAIALYGREEVERTLAPLRATAKQPASE